MYTHIDLLDDHDLDNVRVLIIGWPYGHFYLAQAWLSRSLQLYTTLN